MSKSSDLTASQKLNLKRTYTITWGAVAACTGALVSSRFTLPIEACVLFSFCMAAVSFTSCGFAMGSIPKAFKTFGGVFFAIIAGGLLGALSWVTQSYYPLVLPSVLAGAALIVTTWAGQSRQLNTTRFTRTSVNWALALTLVLTLGSILTEGLSAEPTLQPILGAALGFWAMLMAVAFLDSDRAST